MAFAILFRTFEIRFNQLDLHSLIGKVSLLLIALFALLSFTVYAQIDEKKLKKANELIKQGNERSQKQDYTEALKYYEEAISTAPDFADSYSYKGDVLVKLKRYDEAMAAFRDAARRNYKNTSANYFSMCHLYWNLQKYRETIEVCTEATVYKDTLNPDSLSMIYYDIALAHQSLGEFGKALDAANKGLEFSPNNMGIRRVKAKVLFTLERYEESKTEFKRLTENDLNDHEAFFFLGLTYLVTRDAKKAIEPLEKAVALQPDNANYWNQLASAHLSVDDCQNTLKAAQKTIELDSTSDIAALAYTQMGMCYGTFGNSSLSISAYQKSISLKTPTILYTYFGLGVEQRKIGQYAESEKSFQQCLQIKPKIKEDYGTHAFIYSFNGQFDEAIKYMNLAATFSDDDNDAEYYVATSWYYSLWEQHKAAIDAATRAIQADPKEPMAYTNRCRSYNDLQMYDEALADCQKALELKPNHGETIYYMAIAYRGKGNVKKAAELNTKAVPILKTEVKRRLLLGIPNALLYILGNALRYEQKNAEAIEAYKQALIFYPKFIQLRFNLGGAYVVARDKQGALEQYQELLKLDKKRAEQLMKSIKAMR